MRKYLLLAVIAGATSACTQHDALDPAEQVTADELVGSYYYVEGGAADGYCLVAELALASDGDFDLTVGWADVVSPCEAQAVDPVFGWEGSYRALGGRIALEGVEYEVTETGTREYYGAQDMTASYDAGSESVALRFLDPWGFGGSTRGGKTGGEGGLSVDDGLIFSR